jgi:hypothetical protein
VLNGNWIISGILDAAIPAKVYSYKLRIVDEFGANCSAIPRSLPEEQS